MTVRHFGIPNVRPGLGGNEHQAARLRADTPREHYNLPPLPAQSLRPDPDFSDTDRSNIAGRLAIAFLSLGFLVPLICAGVILHFR
jgi:hypothetical protein